MADAQPTTTPLAGVVDVHVHSAPDTVPRRLDDVEVARAAAAAGMRGVVLKNHQFPTADRARLAATLVPGIDVLGGVVLNAAAGGLNEAAVRAALAVGGRIVWMPTLSAENFRRYMRRTGGSAHLRQLGTGQKVVRVTVAGAPVAALDPILDLLAAHDAVLATGHLSPEETRVVIARARALGVRRILVTHPEQPIMAMPLELQRELADDGVFLERCYINLIEGHTDPARLLAEIRALGVEHVVLSTDLGQSHNPPPVEGMRAYHEVLLAAGLTEAEWQVLAVQNPSRLLGLE